jgi:hypothetical protein
VLREVQLVTVNALRHCVLNDSVDLIVLAFVREEYDARQHDVKATVTNDVKKPAGRFDRLSNR